MTDNEIQGEIDLVITTLLPKLNAWQEVEKPKRSGKYRQIISQFTSVPDYTVETDVKPPVVPRPDIKTWPDFFNDSSIVRGKTRFMSCIDEIDYPGGVFGWQLRVEAKNPDTGNTFSRQIVFNDDSTSDDSGWVVKNII